MNGIFLWCLIAVISCISAEKEEPDKLSTERSCSRSCDTVWYSRGDKKSIACSVHEARACHAIHGSHPSSPLLISGTNDNVKDWYTYVDRENNTRLALYISWRPSYDDSISSVKGYDVSVLNMDGSHSVSHSLCFLLGTTLSNKNFADCLKPQSDTNCGNEFVYDCYGHDDQYPVKPGDEYTVSVSSAPSSDRRAQPTMYSITIPNCADPIMKDVYECKEQGERTITAEVEIFCDDRTVKYFYSIHDDYGLPVTRLFCEKVPGHKKCRTGRDATLGIHEDNHVNGTGSFSLSTAANLSAEYALMVYGSSFESVRKMVNVNFTQCVKPTPPNPDENMAVVGGLIAGIVFLVIILFALLWCCRDQFDFMKKVCWCLISDNSEERVQYTMSERVEGELVESGIVHGTMIAPLNGTPPEVVGEPKEAPTKLPLTTSEESTKPPRVYVVFMEDHELHKDVVHWFCAYLKADLNMDVRMSLWDTIEASANPLMYMSHNLKHADKVIIICSTGTRKCLDRPEWQGDMFTPVVRNIIQESFVGRNPGKFLVAYFDYSEPNDVPEYLYDQTQMYFSLFKLMKQFEQFYFRVAGVEQYHEGGIRRIEKIAFDRYYDPALSKCGKKLKETIDTMTDFCRRNPTWYTDKKGVDVAAVDLPPPPSEAQQTVVPPANDMESMASIMSLEISHPEEIPQKNVGGARRKVKSQPIKAPEPDPPKPHIPAKEDSIALEESMISEDSLDEESYMISEGESLSSHLHPSSQHHPSRALEHADSSTVSDVQNRPVPTEHEQHMSENDYNPSFHPESFGDFNSDIGQQPIKTLDTHQIAKEVSMPRMGRPEHVAMQAIPEAEELAPPIETQIHRKHMSQEPAIFSVKLANLDEHDIDFEDEFKSINLSVQI